MVLTPRITSNGRVDIRQKIVSSGNFLFLDSNNRVDIGIDKSQNLINWENSRKKKKNKNKN